MKSAEYQYTSEHRLQRGNPKVPGSSVYAATKAALRSFARTLSADLLPRGIRVNAVSPGPIATPIFGRMGLQGTGYSYEPAHWSFD